MKIETGLHGVNAFMRNKVCEVLQQIEHEHQVRVLFACESGSRGWGFASPDSDYDVRFIYVHQPEWYLRVESPRDVIEKPIDAELDVCGWEWRKTLGLLKRANPTLLDWLNSPIIYQQNDQVINRLHAISGQFFSAERARWHYRSMAYKNFHHYLQEDSVRLKKYFYVLRPLLAVRWIESGKGVPPMRFDQLLQGTVTDGPLLREIAGLLSAKQRAGEAQFGKRQPAIHAFLETELARTETDLTPETARRDTRLLDRLLFDTVLGDCSPW